MLHGTASAAAEIRTRGIDPALDGPQYPNEVCLLIPPPPASRSEADELTR